MLGSADLPEGIDEVFGGSIEIGWQATGSNRYDALLGYPAFGFGFLTYGFPQTGILGKPNAFYLFLNAPFKRWNKFSLNYILRLGMSYNWEPSDPVANPSHLALGSYRNLYISAGAEGQYLIGEQLSASFGVKFAHFSNGQSSLPNAGMNLLTPHIGIKYDFNGGDRPKYIKYPKPEFTEKGMVYYVTLGNGIRQIFFTPDSTTATLLPKQGVSYPVYNISMGAQYQFGWTGKLGGGVDFIYWGAYNPDIELGQGNVVQAVEYPFSDYLQLGIFISYEFVLNNISIIAQPGYRVIRKEYKGMPTDFYQHLGLKYHVHNLIIGVGIRAVNFGQAEYIEWSLGYRIRKPKK
ncbi:MAG: hypothetical protein DRI71_12185 [Bacteroidetes bacterium]|nr:MAG: hypothetical protein DRI71_12185 [Bacteroidota bacterium]